MLGNILQTRCMDLEFIVLQMVIAMKEPGMRVEDKALGCILSGLVKPSLVTGKMGFLMFLAHRTSPLLFLQWPFIIQKC